MNEIILYILGITLSYNLISESDNGHAGGALLFLSMFWPLLSIGYTVKHAVESLRS